MSATRKSGLGKGLDALIQSSDSADAASSALPSSGIDQIPVEQIVPNPQQPRTVFDEKELGELAASITAHGVIQPLIVMRGEQPDQYVLIAGERRLQAAKLAELDQVPAVIRQANNQDLLELALIENVQRADLSALETAEAYHRLKEEYKLTQEEIGERVGKSRVAVSNTMRLLELSVIVKQALAEGKVTEGQARPLVGLSNQAQQAILTLILDKGLNARQVEELARSYKGEKTAAKKKKAPPVAPEIIELQNELRDSLQTDVKLTHGAKGGTLTLRYFSDEELNKLVDLLLKR